MGINKHIMDFAPALTDAEMIICKKINRLIISSHQNQHHNFTKETVIAFHYCVVILLQQGESFLKLYISNLVKTIQFNIKARIFFVTTNRLFITGDGFGDIIFGSIVSPAEIAMHY